MTSYPLNHLLLSDRNVAVVVRVKNLIDGFYKTRKTKGKNASAYSYECKVCTIRRIVERRKKKDPFQDWSYPDW